MGFGAPDASSIFSKSGDSLKNAGDFAQALRYNMMSAGLTAEAKQRANQYRINAMERENEISNQSAITNAGIGALFDVGGAALGAGIKGMQAGASGAGKYYNDPLSLKTDAWDWKPGGWDMEALNKAYTSKDLPSWSGGW